MKKNQLRQVSNESKQNISSQNDDVKDLIKDLKEYVVEE